MILLLCLQARAAILTVDPAGGGDYTTLREAMAGANSGDTVVAMPGYYQENISFGGKAIILRAAAGPDYTVIDGGDTTDESTVAFVSGEPVGAALVGFTVTNGHGEPELWNLGRSWTGAGVLVSESNASVQDCVIRGNNARHSGQSVGGGVAAIDSYLVLQDNEFSENMGYYAGGAVAVLGGYAQIEDNVFSQNRAGRGGAVALLDGASVALLGNTYLDNEAIYGGAIYAHESTISSVGERYQDNLAYLDGGTLFSLDSAMVFARATLDGGVAARDGGHLHLGPGSTLELNSSALMHGGALVGGAVLVRGEATSLSMDGVLLAGNYAVETGAELWAADAVVLLDQISSLDAETPGSLLWLHGGEGSVVDLAVSGADAAAICEASEQAVTMEWSLIDDFSGEEALGTCATGEGMLRADPLFRDPEQWPPDLSLREGSPAIDAGDPARTDRDMSRADIGATGGGSPWAP